MNENIYKPICASVKLKNELNINEKLLTTWFPQLGKCFKDYIV